MPTKQRGYRIPESAKTCRFANHWSEDVAGDGGSRMPMFECTCEFQENIPEDFMCDETVKCPAYEPCETKICPIHDIEYYEDGDWCELCHPGTED